MGWPFLTLMRNSNVNNWLWWIYIHFFKNGVLKFVLCFFFQAKVQIKEAFSVQTISKDMFFKYLCQDIQSWPTQKELGNYKVQYRQLKIVFLYIQIQSGTCTCTVCNKLVYANNCQSVVLGAWFGGKIRPQSQSEIS